MAISQPDASWDHLYPLFRDRLKAAIAETEQATSVRWQLFEGYRSQERQAWLWASGRSRPGKLITWVRTSSWHASGLAGDVYPAKAPFSSPQSYFVKFREIYEKHGLSNPAWLRGDRGHVQLTDHALRLKALAWVRAGFPVSPDVPPVQPPPEVKVFVDGELVDDAGGSIDNGHVVVALRPIADAFDWNIAKTFKENGNWKGEIVSDHLDQTLPLIMKENKGFVWASQLPVSVSFDGKNKALYLKSSDK